MARRSRFLRSSAVRGADAVVTRRLVIAGALLALVLCAWWLGPQVLVDRLDHLAYDSLLSARARPLTASDVVLVEIDERSLRREGQWPWPRHRLARLIDTIRQAGARTVGLDLLLIEPDRLSPIRLQESVETGLPIEIRLGSVPREALDNDAILAASLSRTSAVLGMWCGFHLEGGAQVAVELPPPSVIVVREPGAPAVAPLPVATRVVPPLTLLADATRAVGFINVLPDADGEVRSVPLLVRYRDEVYPSLALAVVQQAVGASQLTLRVSAAGVEDVRVGGRVLPTDRQGSLLLPFGPTTGLAFSRISATDVLNDRAVAERVRGRVVLVGSSAAAADDSQATPFERRLPGVLLHAVAIDAMLRGDFIRRPGWLLGVQLVVVIVSIALTVILLARGSLGLYAAVAAAMGLVCWFGSRALLVRYGVYVSPVPALLALGSACTLLSLVRFHAEEQAALRSARNLSAAQDCAITGLAAVVETRDLETGQHIIRTRAFVRALAEHLATQPKFRAALSPARLESIVKSAPLHDIGKVGVPDAILLKPGRLTDEEFVVMRRHPTIGKRTLERAETRADADLDESFLRSAGEMAGAHHERWDGSGYPQGRRGEEIPLSARLMALADVYDALRSRRPYKDAMTHEEATALITSGRGTQFDPDVVQAFLEIQSTFIEIARRHADEA